MNKTFKNILMIGPLPPPVGGARVLFQNTVEHIKTHKSVDITVIPLWSLNSSYLSKLSDAIRIFLKVLAVGKRYDVISLWSSRTGMRYFGPLIRLASSIHKKPLILRFFGFGFEGPLDELGLVKRILTRFVFQSSDLILLESHQAVDLLNTQFPAANIAVHPNYRRIPDNPIIPPKQCRKFIYLGKVHELKGIREIIQAAETLRRDDLVVDIYGPFEGDLSEIVFESCQIVKYRGIIDPENVPAVLQEYHALLLPTLHEKEGHPGAILEAYASGLPVIASQRQAIAEIVDESCGILIIPGDVNDLRIAMEKLIDRPEFYQDLIQGALEKRKEYSLEHGVDRFLTYCRDIL